MQYTIVGCLLHLGLAGLGVEGGETISRSSMLKDKNVVVVTQMVILVKMHQTIIKNRCILLRVNYTAIKLIGKKRQSKWGRRMSRI